MEDFFNELCSNFIQYELFDEYLNYMENELCIISSSFQKLKEFEERKTTEKRNEEINSILFLDNWLEKFVLSGVFRDYKPSRLLESDILHWTNLHYFYLSTMESIGFDKIGRIEKFLRFFRCPYLIIYLVFLCRGTIVPMAILNILLVLEDFELLYLLRENFTQSIDWKNFVLFCLGNKSTIPSFIPKPIPNPKKCILWAEKYKPQILFQDSSYHIRVAIANDNLEMYQFFSKIFGRELFKEDICLALNCDSLKIFTYLLIEKSTQLDIRFKYIIPRNECSIFLLSLPDPEKYCLSDS